MNHHFVDYQVELLGLRSYSESSQTGQRGKEVMPRSKKSTQPHTKRQSQPWQLHPAKARFSELFRRARTEGPQVVTRQGKEQVVVLPAEQFARLTKRVRQPKSLVRFFAESPLAYVTLDLSHDLDSGREIKR
jgi:prevent-host-death family protein